MRHDTAVSRGTSPPFWGQARPSPASWRPGRAPFARKAHLFYDEAGMLRHHLAITVRVLPFPLNPNRIAAAPAASNIVNGKGTARINERGGREGQRDTKSSPFFLRQGRVRSPSLFSPAPAKRETHPGIVARMMEKVMPVLLGHRHGFGGKTRNCAHGAGSAPKMTCSKLSHFLLSATLL